MTKFRTISNMPFKAKRGKSHSTKIICLAQNNAETKKSFINILVNYKPEVNLTQVNMVGITLQFRLRKI